MSAACQHDELRRDLRSSNLRYINSGASSGSLQPIPQRRLIDASFAATSRIEASRSIIARAIVTCSLRYFAMGVGRCVGWGVSR